MPEDTVLCFIRRPDQNTSGCWQVYGYGTVPPGAETIEHDDQPTVIIEPEDIFSVRMWCAWYPA